MARLWTTGFEENDASFFDYAEGWVATERPRSGSKSYKLDFGYYVQKNLPNLSEFWLRFAFVCNVQNPTSVTQLVNFRKGGTLIARVYLVNGYPVLQVPTTTVASSNIRLSQDTYYLFEVHFKLHNTAGEFQLKIDGVMTAEYNGNTNTVGASNVDNLQFGNVDGGASWWDDIALNDPSGSVDNNWCGDGRIILLKPNEAGDATQWSASSGANYTCVDEGFPANDDTDYVYSETVDAKDLYNLENPSIPSNSIIRRVWVTARAKKTVSDAAKIALGIKTGGTEYWGSDQDLLTSYKNFQTAEWRQNPSTSSDWTISDLNNLQVGIKAR